MTPAEFRDLRERLGLTQVALADALGTTGNTVARMERGELPINKRIVAALAMLVKLSH